MENAQQSASILVLREGIRRQYETYHARDRDKFPIFEYNTNRANYEPLQASFEQELYVVRRFDRADNSIHIPSTNTLSLMFTDDAYMPNTKILNTCKMYANPKPISEIGSSIPVSVGPGMPSQRILRWFGLLGALLLIASYVIHTVLSQPEQKVVASELKIDSPHNGQVVSRLSVISGKVANADEVWIVLHPAGGKFHIEDVVKVRADGTWQGKIITGGVNEIPTDWMYEVRAFVNPRSYYQSFEKNGTIIFDSWPENVDLATEPILVIRKTKLKL